MCSHYLSGPSRTRALTYSLRIDPRRGGGRNHDRGVVPLATATGVWHSQDAGTVLVLERLANRFGAKSPASGPMANGKVVFFEGPTCRFRRCVRALLDHRCPPCADDSS